MNELLDNTVIPAKAGIQKTPSAENVAGGQGFWIPAVAAALAALLLVACGGRPEATAARPPATALPLVAYDRASAAIGAELVQEYGCNTCHSTDGTTLVGPTWQGLYGTEEELEDGTSATVNDDYIRESIRMPDLKVVKGFTAGLMPATLGVEDDEIPHIIEYMKSLR